MKRPGSGPILRASFRTLRAHPRLLWFPVVMLFGAVLTVGLGATLAWLGSEVAMNPTIELWPWTLLWATDPPADNDIALRGLTTGGLLTLVLLQLWSLVCSVALSRAAMDAMAGREWTVRGSTRAARRRLGAVATVAIAQAGVGRLLRRKPERKKGVVSNLVGRFTSSVLEMAWWAVNYLVVPVLAKETCGGIGALRRSAKLFRKTWKEAFVGRLMLGWVWAGFGVLGVLPAGVCIYLGIQNTTWLLIAIATPGAVALFGVVFVRTLDVIYRTALYVFATEGVVPEPFDDPGLHDVFVVAR